MNFDELTPDVQKDLIVIMMKGKAQTPENQNRARAALQASPSMVKRLLQENNLMDEASKDPDGDGDDDTNADTDTDSGTDDAGLDNKKLGMSDDHE